MQDLTRMPGIPGIAVDGASRGALAPGEALLHVLELIPAAAYTCDSEGLITYFNAQAVRVWGREPALNDPVDRFCGSYRLYCANGEPMAHERCWMALALREQRPYLNCEVTIEQPDGRRLPALAFAQPVHGPDGALKGAVNVLIDISERVELERKIREVERDYADFFEHGPIGLHWVDAHGIIIRANRAELDMLGYQHHEYVGHHISEFYEEPQVAEDILRRLAGGEVLAGHEVRMRCRDGSTKDVAVSSNVRWEGDRFVHSRCFTVDITEKKRAEEALREADARKNEFLAVLAHELRNPLAPIVNAVGYLRREGPVDPGLDQARDIIDRQVVQMSRLVDDLLNLARITRGSLELSTRRITVGVILDNALEIARPLVAEGGHRLSVDAPDEALHVEADQVRMAQVLSNLVGNAARYTEPGGSIRVQVARVPAGPGAGHRVELRVTDSGVGIAAGDLDRIFDMFQQVGQRSGHTRKGLGVGLTLARSIVEMHGGTLEARSEGLGHGSTFTVRLPLVDPPAGRETDASGAESVQAIPKRVLVVDDYQDATVSLARLLEADGHETRVALSGREALQVADGYRPEVVLLDIGLPDLDGYAVCRQLRERPWGRDVLIIALSGWGQDEDKARARSAGFDAHLTKPAGRDELHALLCRE